MVGDFFPVYLRPGHSDVSFPIGVGITGLKRERSAWGGIISDDPIQVMSVSSVSVGWLLAHGKHVSLRYQARADHNYAGRPDVAGRIHRSIQFHVDVVDLGWTVAATHRSRADSELREALNNAVGNMQRIAGLPVNPVPDPLLADLHVLHPTHGESFIERTGSDNDGATEFRAVPQSETPTADSIQGER